MSDKKIIELAAQNARKDAPPNASTAELPNWSNIAAVDADPNKLARSSTIKKKFGHRGASNMVEVEGSSDNLFKSM